MLEKIKECQIQPLELLLHFLQSNYKCGVFLSSVLEEYQRLQQKSPLKLKLEDHLTQVIWRIILERFVISEIDLEKIIGVGRKELRNRISLIESVTSADLRVDRLDCENWIIMLTLEGITNA